MITMSVQEKLKILPPDKQQEVEDFIDEIIRKCQIVEPTADEALIAKRKANMGWAKGKIWMADDFNETPEGFEDYM